MPLLRWWRHLVFLAAAAALLSAALLLQRPASPSGSTTPGRHPRPSGERAPARLAERGLRRSARRFLVAFLRYEVGERGAGVTAVLRRTATPAFAAELLHLPPRSLPGAPVRLAALGGIEIAPLTIAPARILVSGVAHRGGAAEQLDFVFERRGDAWLASGPGE